METFAAKVQYGIGSRFDPMMEERGIWTTTAPQHRDVDMPKAMIKELATANNQISKGELNPFNEQIVEVLPPNVERNFSGSLIRIEAITFKVDTHKLNAHIALSKEQLLNHSDWLPSS